MREIKFRAWDGVQYHYGGFSIHATGKVERTPFVRDDVVIEQFTGLKDRNGKDIYEGDVLMVPVMDGCSPDIEKQIVKSIESLYSSKPCIQWHKGIIIGNIHKNPELLEDIK